MTGRMSSTMVCAILDIQAFNVHSRAVLTVAQWQSTYPKEGGWPVRFRPLESTFEWRARKRVLHSRHLLPIYVISKGLKALHYC